MKEEIKMNILTMRKNKGTIEVKTDRRLYVIDFLNDKILSNGKEIKQYSNMLVDSGVLILNDLTTIESIKYYKLNYPYYLSQIRKII